MESPGYFEDTQKKMDFHLEYPKEEDLVDVFWPANSNNIIVQNRIHASEKPLVIILLGWAGSTHKYLSKYSDMYLKHGCITLRYISPVETTIFVPGKMGIVAEALVKKLHASNLTDHPTFIHAFSNNGSMMLSYLLRELALVRNEIPVNLKGTLLDSAPVPRIFGPFCRMLPTLMPQLGLWRYPVAYGITFALAIVTVWWYLKYAVILITRGESVPQSLSVSRNRQEQIPMNNWLSRILGIRNHPFAFLYSPQDTLVDPSIVENIAHVLKRRGNPVKMFCFSGSNHVQHYREHPKEYTTAIKDFISSAMETDYGSPVFWDELI